MRIEYTQIVGVESDQHCVRIKFRPQGSDSADAPLSIQVNPHKDHVFLNLNFAEFEDGGNCKSLKFSPIT